MQRDKVIQLANDAELCQTMWIEEDCIELDSVVLFANIVADNKQVEMLRLLKEACKPYGKAGECVYSTFKHSLEKAKK